MCGVWGWDVVVVVGEEEVGKGQGLFPGELLLWVKTEGKIC